MPDRIPLIVVTGFLGSGKTTLLQRLLRTPDSADIGFIVNEYGEIGLDHRLLVHSSESVELVGNGCICCARREDIGQAIHQLVRRARSGDGTPIRRIILETTGLADPAPIVATVGRDPWMKAHVRLDAVICVFDSVNGIENIGRHVEAQRQVAVADTIVVTKQDMRDAATMATIVGVVRPISPDAEILDAQSPDFDPRLFARGSTTGRPPRLFFAEAASSHETAWSSFIIPAPHSLDWPVFTLWLSALLHSHGSRILRVKGQIRTTSSKAPVIIHGVQHVMHPPQHLPEEPGGDDAGFLVFITDGIEKTRIERSLLRYQGMA